MLEKFKLKGEALTGWGEMALYVMVCIGQSWNSSLLPCILTEVHFFFFLSERNGSSLQYSCLEKPMDRGARWAIVHGVAKSWTRLKQVSNSSKICTTALHDNVIKSVCPVYTKNNHTSYFYRVNTEIPKYRKEPGFDVSLRIWIKRKCQKLF